PEPEAREDLRHHMAAIVAVAAESEEVVAAVHGTPDPDNLYGHELDPGAPARCESARPLGAERACVRGPQPRGVEADEGLDLVDDGEGEVEAGAELVPHGRGALIALAPEVEDVQVVVGLKVQDRYADLSSVAE